MRDRKGGFTLVEVTVSGALLVMLALVSARGFSVCSRLVLRSSRYRKVEELLESRIAENERPSYTESISLSLGEDGVWDVAVETYKKTDGDVSVTLKTLRSLNEEE